MHVFLDFEASSLSDESYPIEVGWVREAGAREAHLIRPAPDWADWDAQAEAVHQIPRALLLPEGEDHREVARRILDALSPHTVYVTAPSWDGMWLSRLFRASGIPRHAMRFKHAGEAHFAAAVEALAGVVAESELEPLAVGVIQRAEAARDDRPPAHRALADAEAEFDLWREVRRSARAVAQAITDRREAAVP